METNLIERDIDIFLTKYTRFLSKKIYITKSTYDNFLNNYNYLFKELEKNTFLYTNTSRYKKVTTIEFDRIKLLKHHNDKFLKEALSKYDNYFDNIYSKDILNIQKRKIILTEENNILLIDNKNIIPLICTKIKYLIDIKEYQENDFLILVSNSDLILKIKNELKNKFNYCNIDIYTLEEYINKTANYKLINKNNKIEILSNYLKKFLFKDKEKFDKLYKLFKNKIYLNKDYKNYNTFKEYHNYLYQRMYLKSKQPLKKYLEIEINKRKKYLRTINNEIVNYKEEVDIANFLYLNQVSYKYDKQNSLFILNKNYLKYINDNIPKKEKTNYIYLYPKYLDKSTYLSILGYELIKYRYPLEKLSDKSLYNKLKDTTENNYFISFINDYLIPAISYYKNNKFNNLNLTKDEKEQLEAIINYYKNYLNINNLIDEDDLINITNKKINTKDYKYLINLSNVELSEKINSLTIIPDYKENNIIFRDNLKLFYDYKKYLNDYKTLSISNTYLNYEEISNITNEYIEQNLKIIEQYLKDKTKKNINIYIYNDNNRLLINNNKSTITNNIISNLNKKNKILILGKDKKDIDSILINNYFSKKNISTINHKYSNIDIDYKDYSNKIDAIYNNIILINLIKDKYNDNILDININYKIKSLLYIALTKSKEEIYILWPKSKQKIINSLNLKNISIYE